MKAAGVVAMVLALIAFLLAIGIRAFQITDGLEGLPAGGQGAFALLIGGALLLICFFLALMVRQHRRNRRSADSRPRNDGA